MGDPELELGICALRTNPEPNESDDRLSGLDELLDLNRKIADRLLLICGPRFDFVHAPQWCAERGLARWDKLEIASRIFDHAAPVPRFHASMALRTISTFSCDIAYSDSPAASRAFSRSTKSL